jgi:hypothetical protein
MIQQQYITASEGDFLRNADVLRQTLLSQKISAIRIGIFIPDSLIAEIEQFVARNQLSNEIDAAYLTQVPNEVCPHCLKAHAMHRARLLDLPAESVEFIGKLLLGNRGHNGYYMDECNMVKIEE